jgi:DNA-binding NarL/FixJ family response regulator
MMDTGAKKAMVPQRSHNSYERRALTVSMPGLLFLGPQRDLIASNAEAIRILYYPDKPDKVRQLSALVSDRLPIDLLRVPQGRAIAEFMSGRRRYICTVHSLDIVGRNKANIAILLERVPSPEVTLYGICKRYNLTTREQEAMGCLLRGLTSKEIGQEMNISPNTVKAFLRSAMMKMGVGTRAGLIGRIAGTMSPDVRYFYSSEGTRGS